MFLRFYSDYKFLRFYSVADAIKLFFFANEEFLHFSLLSKVINFCLHLFVSVNIHSKFNYVLLKNSVNVIIFP